MLRLSGWGVRASYCRGFSLQSTGSRVLWLQWLWSVGSVVTARGLSCRWHVKSSRDIDGTRVPYTGRQIPNHRTTGDVLVVGVFSRSVTSDSFRPHGLQHARLLSFTISQSLLELMSIDSVMPSNHLILSSLSPPTFSLSQNQGLF